MARILAFDFGTKRTGIAVTDNLQIIATALKVVSDTELIPFVKQYLNSEQVETIVVGEPKHLDGNLSGPIEALNNFVRFLEKSYPNIPIKRIDERFTSSMAMQTLLTSGASKKQRAAKENTDQVAAVIILQSYLEQQQFIKGR
jgi:putative Holliday junction resolvase